MRKQLATATVLALSLHMSITAFGAEETSWNEAERIREANNSYERMITFTKALAEGLGAPKNAYDVGRPVYSDPVVMKDYSKADQVIIRDMDGKIIATVPGNQAETYIKNNVVSSKTTGVKTSSGSSSGGVTTTSSNTKDGPGAKSSIQIEDSTGKTGPVVEKLSLQETYHEDYDIYTQSMGDRYFIYTNVSNKGITDQPVSLDIPQGIHYVLEKDGVEIPYTSKDNLSENGTYVFRFWAMEDASKPLSQQTVYESTFNFRIQPKPVRPTEAAGGSSSADSWNSGYSYDRYAESGATDWTSITETPGYQTYDSELTESTLEESTAEETEGSLYETEEETVSGTETSADAAAEAETDTNRSDTVGTDLYEEVFVPNSGLYRIRFADGTYFLTNLPNGMLSNAAAALEFTGLGGITPVILKDGEVYQVPEDAVFTEIGSYTILIPVGTKKAVYSFTLIGQGVSDLQYYKIPKMLKITSFTRDDEDLYNQVRGKGLLDFTKDGLYELEMENEEGYQFTSELNVDHQPPVFSVVVSGKESKADIHLESDDVQYITVEKNGKTETYQSLGTINGAGKYIVSVYDFAGNVSTQTIVIPGRINLATVAAVLIILGLIAAAVVFIRKTKHDFNVK